MITRNLIDIPNHPLLTDVVRKAQVFRSYNEYDTNRVVMPVKVYHFKDDQPLNYFPKDVELIVDNDTMVNPATGAIVEKDEEGNYPEGSIGEYDYLWAVVNVAKAYTQQELEEIYIPQRIEKINAKLYV